MTDPAVAAGFADVEALIVDKLTLDVTAAKAVTTYAGQLEDLLEGAPVKGMPLLTVMFAGSALEQVAGPIVHAVYDFTIGVFAHSLRGGEATRTDPDTGAYALVEAVLTSLTNKRLASNLEHMVPKDVALIYADSKVMAYRVTFSVGMDAEYALEG